MTGHLARSAAAANVHDDLRRVGALAAHDGVVHAIDGTGSDVPRHTDSTGLDWLPERSTEPTR